MRIASFACSFMPRAGCDFWDWTNQIHKRAMVPMCTFDSIKPTHLQQQATVFSSLLSSLVFEAIFSRLLQYLEIRGCSLVLVEPQLGISWIPNFLALPVPGGETILH